MSTIRHRVGSGAESGKLLGAYRLLTELGSGGMGTVYLAEVERAVLELEVGQQVAVKVIHPHLLARLGVFKRFLREAEVGKLIRHPNVVRTFDADAIELDNRTAHHLVMEYVEGQTLRALLGELGRVPEELCRHIAREVACALVTIHEKGIIHRDLKPENVLITQDHVVKVMDLGIARLVDEEFRLSMTGAFVGSVLYGAPEQFEGVETDGRTDLYALGLTLFELVTGRHPFADDAGAIAFGRQLEGDLPMASEFNSELTPFFEELLKTLLARNRDRRFQSANELFRILEECEESAWWRERAQAMRAAAKRSPRRIRVPRETALYGRAAELAELETLFERAKAGDGQVLLIEGEAGIGKTRLIDEFVRQLRSANDGVNLLYGSYPPGGAATATSAFCSAFRNHLWDDGLEQSVHNCLTLAPGLVPAFAALLKGEATPKGEAPLTKDTLQTVFIQATRALSRERVTVVQIDDLHFTSKEGLALFAGLSLAVQGHRVLLVGTTRPGLPEDWLAGVDRLHHARRLRLSRLGPKDLALLLIDAVGCELLARELAFPIGRKSDGNPLFALEIIRGLREAGVIVEQKDGTWRKTGTIEDLMIPESVTDLIRARIAELDEGEKDLLEVASCCGFEFDPGLVADTIGESRVPVLKQLGRIEKRHQLVRSAGLRFLFDHHQIQVVLYQGLPGMLRQEYHAAIGQALEEREQARTRDPLELEGAVAVEICRHFFEGARGDRGLRYLDAALTHQESSYLNDAAMHLADLALSVRGLLKGKERVKVILRKVRRLDILGRPEDEKAALDEALSIAASVDDAVLHCRIQRALGAYYTRIADYGSARESLAQALDLARKTGDRRVEATSTDSMGVALMHLGLFEEAREHHERALALHRENGDARGVARSTNNLEFVLGKLGLYEEARVHHERALSLAREIGYQRGETRARNNLGYACARLGQIDQARRHHELALSLSRDIGYRRGEGHALHGLGIVADATDEAERAVRCYEKALALRREIGDRRGAASTLTNLGRLLAMQGREETATRHFDEAFRIARESKLSTPLLLAAAHRMLLPGGDVNRLLDLLDRHERFLIRGGRMVVRFLLWKATKDPQYLEQAHDLLTYLRDHAPSECRESMVENVPMHRDIANAWRDHCRR